MIAFESGIVGLAAFLLLCGTALLGAVRAVRNGNLPAAAVAASLVGFLCSSGFDYLTEAPRIATLFYLVCFIGLAGLRAPNHPSPEAKPWPG